MGLGPSAKHVDVAAGKVNFGSDYQSAVFYDEQNNVVAAFSHIYSVVRVERS